MVNRARRPLSLKTHIKALGILAFAALVLAMLLGMSVLSQTESSMVANAVRDMARLADRLAARYDYLARTFPSKMIVRSPFTKNTALLRSLTESVLTGMEGVEGGFYSVQADRLVGYAYPTYHGSGTKRDVPATERPTILRIIKQAIQAGEEVEEQVISGPDILLFRARPLAEAGEVAGAVWLMHRLRGIRTVDRQLYGLGLIGLLGAASTVAVGAWLVARRLDGGLSRIGAGLHKMEEQLDCPLAPVGIFELDCIGSEINRLAMVIKDQQTRRINLERQLHEADRLAVLGRLVAGVAHELRNPLSSIKLKIQLARQNPLFPSYFRKAMDVVEEECARLDRLVVRLLSLAKPSHQSRAPTDLIQFLSHRLEHWHPRAASRGITLQLVGGDVILQPVVIDRDRVGQILDNLLANSFDALGLKEGLITVEVSRVESSTVTIVVSDNGPGIPPEMADRLFEPFSTTKPQGTGLGLFLSAETARALGGSLRYANAPGGGARFEVHIPC